MKHDEIKAAYDVYFDAELAYDTLLDRYQMHLEKRVSMFYKLRYVYITEIMFQKEGVRWAERFQNDDDFAGIGYITYELLDMPLDEFLEQVELCKAITQFFVRLRHSWKTRSEKEEREARERRQYERLREKYGE